MIHFIGFMEILLLKNIIVISSGRVMLTVHVTMKVKRTIY